MIIYNAVVCVPPKACQQCLKSNKCNPPDCFCCRDELKLPRISLTQIPQIVFFTFDDAVTEQVSGFYHQLFHPSRKNPNNCPISMTLFISHDNTKYRLVSEFHRRGMEIASHSVTHNTMNGSNFMQEAKAQKENLAKLANIPINEITGWRSPFLKPTGDLQPDALKKLGYTYDATLTFSKRSFQEKPPGPFTLDFGYPYECQVKPCPKHSHPGFWEVPVVSLLDYKQAYDCVYVDGCMNAPPDEEKAYKFLWDNFHNYYTTTRMPFGINMHPSWFYYPDRLKAMDRFIQKLVSLNDVYIISANRMLEWLKQPTPLRDLHSFAPWACDGREKSSQTGPRLVKTNLPRAPIPPRSFISWTNAPSSAERPRAPATRQRAVTHTRLFTPTKGKSESTRFTNVSPRKHLFTLDLTQTRLRPSRTRDLWKTRQQTPTKEPANIRRTIRPEIQTALPPITAKVSQLDRLQQHEERMRRRRILEQQTRQEQRRRQQRHQELLEQQLQQQQQKQKPVDIAASRSKPELRSSQRIIWKPAPISSEPLPENSKQSENIRAWQPKIHQETVKVWPHIGQSVNRIPQTRGHQRSRFNSRGGSDINALNIRNIQNTVVTAAPSPTPTRNTIRRTDSPRHVWYADMRSRFGPMTNQPRFSRGGSNRRPGFIDPGALTRSQTSSRPRQRRVQVQGSRFANATAPRQFRARDETRRTSLRVDPTRGRLIPAELANRVSNDLTAERRSRDRSINNRATSMGTFSRNVLHPTVAQQLAWTSFIRQMLGPH